MNAICKSFKKTENASETPTTEDNNHRAFLLHIKGTTIKISNMLMKYGIITVFQPYKKPAQLLKPIKGRIVFNTEGIYKIMCICGKNNIVQTSHLISTRVQEHVRYTKNLVAEKSAAAEHSATANHLINFENASVVVCAIGIMTQCP